MTEFKLEERYIVIKRKHLDLSTEGRLRGVLYDLDISTVECVVVEEDWHPIYQETWENVQRFAEDKPSIGEERDSLQSKLSEATTRIERMENLFFLAMDFIDKHPADPDISKDQTEAWLKILNSNAMDEFARLRQQGKG